MTDVRKVSTIAWITILIRRFKEFEDEFYKVFKRPLNDYWVSLIGLRLGKFADDLFDANGRWSKPGVNGWLAFEDRVKDRYGDDAWDMLSQLLMLDYEIDKTIKEDVTWGNDHVGT